MSKAYRSNNIKVLDELDAIRQNPGKDIGDTSTPIQLLHECIDNALDEIAVHGSRVEITINNKDHVYSVEDNGRGLPLGTIKYNNEEVPVPILVCSKLFSSGKFDKNSYLVPCGLHGIGLVAVNALSLWLEIEVYRDNKHGLFRFENGICVLKNIEETKTNKTGTKVTFSPDPKYFEHNTIDVESIKHRLQIALLYDDMMDKEIILNNEKIKLPKTFPLLANVSKVFHVTAKADHETFTILFGWDKEQLDQKAMGAVNKIPVNQGRHIDLARQVIRDAVTSMKWDFKLSANNDYLRGIRIIALTQIYNTKFLGQTKDKLLTPLPYLSERFSKQLTKQIKEELKKSRSLINSHIKRIYQYLKMVRSKLKLDDLIANTSSNGSSSRQTSRGLNIPNLRDCLSTDVDKCTLYIVEGRSASGPVNDARDPRYDAIYLLQGKPPNAIKAKNTYKLLTSSKSQELIGLVKTLGCGISGKNAIFDIDKLRYSKIVICADADPDGLHITCLLISIFISLMKPIVEEGKLYICEPPLYGLTSKKKNSKFIPIWNKSDLENYDLRQYYLHRFKGLGEMNGTQLHEILFNTKTRRIHQLTLEDVDESKLLKLMSNDTKIRYKLLKEHNLIIEGEGI